MPFVFAAFIAFLSALVAGHAIRQVVIATKFLRDIDMRLSPDLVSRLRRRHAPTFEAVDVLGIEPRTGPSTRAALAHFPRITAYRHVQRPQVLELYIKELKARANWLGVMVPSILAIYGAAIGVAAAPAIRQTGKVLESVRDLTEDGNLVVVTVQLAAVVGGWICVILAPIALHAYVSGSRRSIEAHQREAQRALDKARLSQNFLR